MQPFAHIGIAHPEQGGHLLALPRDGVALRVVLVVGGDLLGRGDDVVEALLERHDLAHGPGPLLREPLGVTGVHG